LNTTFDQGNAADTKRQATRKPRRRKMKVRNENQIEKMRIAIGSAAIIAVVALTTAAAAVLGLAQMA